MYNTLIATHLPLPSTAKTPLRVVQADDGRQNNLTIIKAGENARGMLPTNSPNAALTGSKQRATKVNTEKIGPHRWSFLKDASPDDWVAERNKHPKWKGYSSKDFNEDSKSGARSFYAAGLRWCANQATDKETGIIDKNIQRNLKRTLFPSKLNDHSHLVELADWVTERNKHKEWENYSADDFKKNLENGACSFYYAFSVWRRNQSTDKITKRVDEKLKKTITDAMFPPKNIDYSHLTTLEGWVEERKKHPEWDSYSTKDFKKDKKSGACKFYFAFSRWRRNQSKDEGEQKDDKSKPTAANDEKTNTTNLVFPPKQRDYSHLAAIEDWIDERKKHPEWDSYFTSDFSKDRKSGAGSFYEAFRRWCKNQSTDKITKKIDKIKVRTYMNAVFSLRNRDFSHLITIEDWVEARRKQKEWDGYSTLDFSTDKESGASAFYYAFRAWRKIQSTDENTKEIDKNLQRNLTNAVFPPRVSSSYLFDFGFGNVSFDSFPERAIAILLNKYCIIESFHENINLHVRVNGKRKHSIDFLVDGVFLEYHPVSIIDRKEGRNTEQSGERKHQSITNPAYLSLPFVHIWEINQLYEKFLMRPDIKCKLPTVFEALTFEQFKQHVAEARKQAVAYDIKTGAIEDKAKDANQMEIPF